ncbi:MAG: fructose-6-phosphate aldolase [Ignavibacteria bacterium GWF2_33_9]|nr:MAG: fructose-6-phosphate aldolase [Ignavibacteria bacterium GWF2_33_9]
MQIYLDTANISHIREAAAWGILSGVTTNPSLLAKEDPNVDVKERIREIHSLVGGHLSVEVISTETDGMVREAHEILEWFPEATIKIPMIPTGLGAVKRLSDENIPTNVTLIFNPVQALAANNAGATYVSVFLGRIDDIGMSSSAILEEITGIWYTHNLESQIIAASIRTPLHIIESAKLGAHIATVPYNTLKQSLQHPLTDKGVQLFLDDYAKMQTEIAKLKG